MHKRPFHLDVAVTILSNGGTAKLPYIYQKIQDVSSSPQALSRGAIRRTIVKHSSNSNPKIEPENDWFYQVGSKHRGEWGVWKERIPYLLSIASEPQNPILPDVLEPEMPPTIVAEPPDTMPIEGLSLELTPTESASEVPDEGSGEGLEFKADTRATTSKIANLQHVPQHGPLSVGGIYPRSELHGRFGGNHNAGIVPSKREKVVLLFHTKEPNRQFYRDDFDEQGVYWYSGQGTSGDMTWNASNRAVRDHQSEGTDLLLFERAQREGGLWRFIATMTCVHVKIERREDNKGADRNALVFGLLPLETVQQAGEFTTGLSDNTVAGSATDKESESTEVSTTQAIRRIFIRAREVREQALNRASGVCEACDNPAPFARSTGEPYLEVHHIDRLADGGPDRIDQVAAICSNCHARCHYSVDSADYNAKLRGKIKSKEQS